MDSLNERIVEIERVFNEYKEKTDLRIEELENKLKQKNLNNEFISKKENVCMIKDSLDITIVKYKKSILVKSTNSYNTTQPYKELFKELEGKWMKTGETFGWIYLGKCPDDLLKKNSQFIIEHLKKKEIEYTVIYE
tara:strand:- start:112 stop:519 length:408 start_codon:yes stop_codon:yes gene_type:complete